jgi:hypothetical protein
MELQLVEVVLEIKRVRLVMVATLFFLQSLQPEADRVVLAVETRQV